MLEFFQMPSWGRILGHNSDKSLKRFPPCYSQSSLQLCLEISISSNSRNLYSFLRWSLCTVQEKGGKPDRKPYPLSFGLRKPYRNQKSENSQDYAQKPQRNCTFMNSASVLSSIVAISALIGLTTRSSIFPRCGLVLLPNGGFCNGCITEQI